MHYLITFSTADVLLLLICYRVTLFILIWSVLISISLPCVSGEKATVFLLFSYTDILQSVRIKLGWTFIFHRANNRCSYLKVMQALRVCVCLCVCKVEFFWGWSPSDRAMMILQRRKLMTFITKLYIYAIHVYIYIHTHTY